MTELFKDAILTAEQAGQVQTSRVHYSSLKHVNDVFGAQGIYVDNLTIDEVIKLKISRIKV
jgi:hypothetical protein